MIADPEKKEPDQGPEQTWALVRFAEPLLAPRGSARTLAKMTRRAGLLIMILIATGCSKPKSEWVYVPGPEYKSEVEITLPATARVGEEIVLQGRRTSGPWQSVKRIEAKEEEGSVLWTREPPGKEEGFSVTGNLRWEVIPSGRALFGQHGMTERTVTFSAPGKYRVQGFSAFPSRAVSNEVEIVVGK